MKKFKKNKEFKSRIRKNNYKYNNMILIILIKCMITKILKINNK